MIEAAKLEADIYPAGPRGLSAYEIYKKEGGQLSEEEWLNSNYWRKWKLVSWNCRYRFTK